MSLNSYIKKKLDIYLREFLESMYSKEQLEHLYLVWDKFIENAIQKPIYIACSKFVTFTEWKECLNPQLDFNYLKLHCESMSEENLIVPNSYWRMFELRNGKFYSLISGLEYPRNLNEDAKIDCELGLVKLDFVSPRKSAS